MRLILAMFLFVVACTNPIDAQNSAIQYVRSIGLHPAVARCVRACGEDNARCTVVTRTEQVYTLICRFGDCWIERGPGQ